MDDAPQQHLEAPQKEHEEAIASSSSSSSNTRSKIKAEPTRAPKPSKGKRGKAAQATSAPPVMINLVDDDAPAHCAPSQAAVPCATNESDVSAPHVPQPLLQPQPQLQPDVMPDIMPEALPEILPETLPEALPEAPLKCEPMEVAEQKQEQEQEHVQEHVQEQEPDQEMASEQPEVSWEALVQAFHLELEPCELNSKSAPSLALALLAFCPLSSGSERLLLIPCSLHFSSPLLLLLTSLLPRREAKLPRPAELRAHARLRQQARRVGRARDAPAPPRSGA